MLSEETQRTLIEEVTMKARPYGSVLSAELKREQDALTVARIEVTQGQTLGESWGKSQD